MILAITYDLNRPGKDYSALFEAIKKIGSWWHYLDSFWLVDTEVTVEESSEQLRERIDENDRLLVIRVTSDSAGWLPKEAWEWLRQRAY